MIRVSIYYIVVKVLTYIRFVVIKIPNLNNIMRILNMYIHKFIYLQADSCANLYIYNSYSRIFLDFFYTLYILGLSKFKHDVSKYFDFNVIK